MIARRRDGPRGAKIEAAIAADDPRARMDAEILGKGNVAWLVESADQIACLEHCPKHARGIAGVSAQITVAQVRRREQRYAARKIKDDIAARHRPVPGGSKVKCAARRWRRLRIVVDGQFECAEVALGRTYPALHHRERRDPGRNDAGRRRDQHRHVEMVLEQVRSLNRLLVTSINEHDPATVEGDGGDFGHALRSRRDQRRHLGARIRGLV